MGRVREQRRACRESPPTSSFSLLRQVKFPLVEKCEVGGQWIFVYDSSQIIVHRDTKKAISEISKDVLVEVLEKIQSISGRTYILKLKQRQQSIFLKLETFWQFTIVFLSVCYIFAVWIHDD